ncbi:MAG TPA: hypothetical protein VJX67_11665, partial [Blastocatellia bacterium]|nr:hypothetical protein [Blastocatellia bacterium]
MPNRREFLGGLLGIGAAQLSGALGIAARGSAHAGTARLLLEGRARSLNPFVPDQRASFGSGYFGEWITDEFGLPAYRYTCNQIIDPKARTPVHKEWRSQSDHTHQVGNDRLVASVSNYGYVQVRQDEGSPKFLNDYSPEDGRYGGGIGFLTDGDILLSTYYQPGNAASFERVFGVGYLKKTVKGGPYEINQVILAPFGDDPVLISQVTITNHGSEPREIRWIEYWGCHPYQF